mmetsp:Transcript_4910/g.12003  ORF Transcript_4910/g.12003 Transcript_4910/m.12003 type:complete len:294 (+) Transcript_4910:700-1581(+)
MDHPGGQWSGWIVGLIPGHVPHDGDSRRHDQDGSHFQSARDGCSFWFHHPRGRFQDDHPGRARIPAAHRILHVHRLETHPLCGIDSGDGTDRRQVQHGTVALCLQQSHCHLCVEPVVVDRLSGHLLRRGGLRRRGLLRQGDQRRIGLFVPGQLLLDGTDHQECCAHNGGRDGGHLVVCSGGGPQFLLRGDPEVLPPVRHDLLWIHLLWIPHRGDHTGDAGNGSVPSSGEPKSQAHGLRGRLHLSHSGSGRDVLQQVGLCVRGVVRVWLRGGLVQGPFVVPSPRLVLDHCRLSR